ncbi:MAG: LysR family transcriptional regulator ArgP [Rhodoferax sp.]|nr:LysR family transcriptional regulator ArgP [Rhodoferax sp.]
MCSLDLDALECLAAIVEEGGFERAATRLSITQSAVSQRLRSLEMQTGTVLIVRSRPIKVTPAGQMLLKHALQMRLLRADLERELKELAPGGSSLGIDQEQIAIAVNADSIGTWALPALDQLARQGLAIEVIVDDQDFTQGWLREGQVLGCITTLEHALRGCKVLPLGSMQYVAVAHPEFAAARCPEGLSAYNFRRLPFIAFNRKDDSQCDFVGRAFGLNKVKLRQFHVPSTQGQLRAVEARWGVSWLPELQVRDKLRRGELVNLMPELPLAIDLYWHCWNLDSPVLDALTKALISTAAASLSGPRTPGGAGRAPQAAPPGRLERELIAEAA